MFQELGMEDKEGVAWSFRSHRCSASTTIGHYAERGGRDEIQNGELARAHQPIVKCSACSRVADSDMGVGQKGPTAWAANNGWMWPSAGALPLPKVVLLRVVCWPVTSTYNISYNSWKLTSNLKISPSKRKIIFQASMFGVKMLDFRRV